MLCLVPFVLWIRTDWAVVGSWGVGALVATIVGLTLVHIRPQLASAALRWWSATVSSLGRWLVGASLVSIVCSYGAVLLLAAVLGATQLGGLRAVLSAMTPLSLIVPAISLPGLPALARASARSGVEARKLAWQLGMRCRSHQRQPMSCCSASPRVFLHSCSAMPSAGTPRWSGLLASAKLQPRLPSAS